MASDELAAKQTNIAMNYNELFHGNQLYETC